MIGDQLLSRKAPNEARRQVTLTKKAREPKSLERPPLVLDCECGEKLVLIGQEDDYWRWAKTLLECGGCEEKFMLL